MNIHSTKLIQNRASFEGKSQKPKNSRAKQFAKGAIIAGTALVGAASMSSCDEIFQDKPDSTEITQSPTYSNIDTFCKKYNINVESKASITEAINKLNEENIQQVYIDSQLYDLRLLTDQGNYNDFYNSSENPLLVIGATNKTEDIHVYGSENDDIFILNGFGSFDAFGGNDYAMLMNANGSIDLGDGYNKMIAKSIYANTITTGNQKDSIILDDSYVDDIYLAGNDDNLTLVGNTTVNLANGGEGTNTLTINNPKTTEVNKTKNFFNIKGLFDDKNHFLSHFKFLENYKKPKSNIVENAINKLQELGAKVLTFNDGSQYNIFLSTKDETVEGTSSQDIIITTIGNSNAQEGDDIIIGKNVDASLFGPGDDIGIFNKAEFIDGESGKDALYAAKATMAKNIEKNHVGN